MVVAMGFSSKQGHHRELSQQSAASPSGLTSQIIVTLSASPSVVVMP